VLFIRAKYIFTAQMPHVVIREKGVVILRKVEDNVAVDVPKICVHQLKNRGMNRGGLYVIGPLALRIWKLGQRKSPITQCFLCHPYSHMSKNISTLVV